MFGTQCMLVQAGLLHIVNHSREYRTRRVEPPPAGHAHRSPAIPVRPRRHETLSKESSEADEDNTRGTRSFESMVSQRSRGSEAATTRGRKSLVDQLVSVPSLSGTAGKAVQVSSALSCVGVIY